MSMPMPTGIQSVSQIPGGLAATVVVNGTNVSITIPITYSGPGAQIPGLGLDDQYWPWSGIPVSGWEHDIMGVLGQPPSEQDIADIVNWNHGRF
jgi:hypothetical protein